MTLKVYLTIILMYMQRYISIYDDSKKRKSNISFMT